jgi:hypothetical protein
VPPGANGPHVNKADRQAESAKAELIMNIIGALKARFPGDDKTARQDRSDMSRTLFGVPSAQDLKSLPLSILQEGYARLTRPVIGERPPAQDPWDEPPPVEDVPDYPSPTPDPGAEGPVMVDGEPVDPRTGEVLRPHPVESRVTGVGDLDDETATESLLAQLERYAESQGMVPAWQGLLRAYDAYRLEDGVLILTAEERQALLAQTAGVWPGVEDVGRLP